MVPHLDGLAGRGFHRVVHLVNAGQTEPEKAARTIELPNSVLRKHLKIARIDGPAFNGLLLPSWDSLTKDKKEEFLKIVVEFAKEKGCSEVKLLNSEGHPAASASATKSEINTL